MLKKLFSKIISIFPHIFALLFILVFTAFAWTEPSVAPPGGNVSAPLNIGSTGQSKAGGLILGTNCVGSCVNGLIVDKGKVGIGETNPSEKLDVAGNIDLNSNAIKNVGSVNFNDGTSQGTAADTLGVFGDGSDGNVTVSSNSQLARDMYYNNLTVNAGVELKTNGFRVHVKNTAIINGTISNNGQTAVSANPGAGAVAGSLGGGAYGGIGWGRDFIDYALLRGKSANSSLGGNGGGGTGSEGALYGTAVPPAAGAGGFRALPSVYLLRDFEAGLKIQGGAGGSGTAVDYNGGGGGGGGGVIFFASRILVLNGSIQANGGNGGQGFCEYSCNGSGSGSGGGGGAVIVIYNLKSGGGAIQVQGGTGAFNGSPGQTIEIDLP